MAQGQCARDSAPLVSARLFDPADPRAIRRKLRGGKGKRERSHGRKKEVQDSAPCACSAHVWLSSGRGAAWRSSAHAAGAAGRTTSPVHAAKAMTGRPHAAHKESGVRPPLASPVRVSPLTIGDAVGQSSSLGHSLHRSVVSHVQRMQGGSRLRVRVCGQEFQRTRGSRVCSGASSL